jgi:HEAT repeat protein
MLRHLIYGSLISSAFCLTAVSCSGPEPQTVVAEQVDDLIATMKTKLNDPDPRTRAFAATFLGGHGEKAKDAIPQLRELTKDKAREVREAATTALGRLEAAAPPPP